MKMHAVLGNCIMLAGRHKFTSIDGTSFLNPTTQVPVRHVIIPIVNKLYQVSCGLQWHNVLTIFH